MKTKRRKDEKKEKIRKRCDSVEDKNDEGSRRKNTEL